MNDRPSLMDALVENRTSAESGWPTVRTVEPSCERCGNPNVVGLWNPSRLGGHEILVCGPCWTDLVNQ